MTGSVVDQYGLDSARRAALRSVRRKVFLAWCSVTGLRFNEAGFGMSENRATLEAFGALIGRHSIPSTISALSGNTHCATAVVIQLRKAFQQQGFCDQAQKLGVDLGELPLHAFLQPGLWADVGFSLEEAAKAAGEERRAAIPAESSRGSTPTQPEPKPSKTERRPASPRSTPAPTAAVEHPKTETPGAPSRRGKARGPAVSLCCTLNRPRPDEGQSGLLTQARVECLEALAAVFAPTEIKVRRSFPAAVARLGNDGATLGLTAAVFNASLSGKTHIERPLLEQYFARLHLGKDTIRAQFRGEGVEGQADLRVFTKQFAELVLTGKGIDEALQHVRAIGKYEGESFRIEPRPDDKPCDVWAERYGRAAVILEEKASVEIDEDPAGD